MFTQRHYEAMATHICGMADDADRAREARFWGDYFEARSSKFRPSIWYRWCRVDLPGTTATTEAAA